MHPESRRFALVFLRRWTLLGLVAWLLLPWPESLSLWLGAPAFWLWIAPALSLALLSSLGQPLNSHTARRRGTQ